jgi:[ribosomal protein S5]-alanine N-acetyltransferase
MVIFQTERLHVRHLLAGDADAMYAVYGDAEAMRWVGDGEPLPREECVRWVEVTHANYARRGYGMSALVEKQSNEVIGFCGIVHPGGQPEAEIKYALRREFWGCGLATEAVTAMLRYGAREFGLREVIATVYPENVASHRVLLKAGMQSGESRRNEDGTFTQVFVWHAPESQ